MLLSALSSLSRVENLMILCQPVPFCHELSAIVLKHQGHGIDALSTLFVMVRSSYKMNDVSLLNNFRSYRACAVSFSLVWPVLWWVLFFTSWAKQNWVG